MAYKKDQSLDDYIKMFEEIFEPIQNVERDFNEVLARLLEAIAECSQHINKHHQIGLAENLPKVFSWYCSLVVKSRINGLSEATWTKFPYCCPYCLHAPCICPTGKKDLFDNKENLHTLAKENLTKKPQTLTDWQTMFGVIYPRSQGYDQKSNFAHLIEELGEAYRLRYFYPKDLEGELADIFTWILGMANLLDSRAKDGILNEHYVYYDLAEEVFKKYGGVCPNCKHIPCSCITNSSKQKISELNVLYPDQVMKAIEQTREEINNIFNQPEAQNMLQEMNKLIKDSEINEANVQNLINKLIEEPSNKKWYDRITASGITESVIASAFAMFLQFSLSFSIIL